MISKVIVFANSYIILRDSGSVTGKNGSYDDDEEVQAWIAEGNEPEQYVEPEPTYAELRQREYPQIGEQLDMLYHAIDSGVFGEDAKNINFFTSLKAVKEKYPKPEGL